MGATSTGTGAYDTGATTGSEYNTGVTGAATTGSTGAYETGATTGTTTGGVIPESDVRADHSRTNNPINKCIGFASNSAAAMRAAAWR